MAAKGVTLRRGGGGGLVAAGPAVEEAAELVAALLGEVPQLAALLAGAAIEATQGALCSSQVKQPLVVVHRSCAVKAARRLHCLRRRLQQQTTTTNIFRS